MTRDAALRALLLLCFFRPLQSAQPVTLDLLAVDQSVDVRLDAAPHQFVAVHGRKAVVMGYSEKGLEIWGYPFQILSHYQVGFRAEGTDRATDGQQLLRSIVYRPDSITRTYIGPDYLVREKLFVPLNQAAVVISYEIEGIRRVEVDVSFAPVLNLMWPAALGGQYTRWFGDGVKEAGVPSFVISEPTRGFSAAIGSREIVSHSDTVNSTIPTQSPTSFSLRPSPLRKGSPSKATVYVVLNSAHTERPTQSLLAVSGQLPELEAEAATHYQELERSSIHIRTPDNTLNRTIASAIIALDQAWVCNDLLGCGIIAGYGPSRDARRPQYDWFFGGDGLVTTNALVAAGDYSRAREELSFIQKYQDPASGMIWHELSQSAGFIDWSKFPYMYVHVDISFDYLTTLARYVSVSGDVAFARKQWASVMAAYRYCLSQINSRDHLPHIPADKEAGDEQHRPADDLNLSASWMSAASGFAELARLTGHHDQVPGALDQVQLTRQSISTHYWSAERNFWLNGHTQSGEPIFRQAAGPTPLLVQRVFSSEQTEAVLSQLTSADFQADWGIRGVAASSRDYNPYSYSAGSVSAHGTSAVATTLWQVHRPESAWGLWNGIAQWSKLDSPAHIHEVLVGNFFHEQTESVPEQTWSSAGFLEATVRGLFGLEIDAAASTVRFSPHLPAEWPEASVENIRLPHSTLGFHISQSMTGIDLKITNQGPVTTVTFEPQIPLGAQISKAEFDGQTIAASLESFPGDEHAKVILFVPPGASQLSLKFQGGFSILVQTPVLQVGDPSRGLKIVSVNFRSQVLSIEVDLAPGGDNKLRIRTPWKIITHQGADVKSLTPNLNEVSVKRTGASLSEPYGYTRQHLELTFAQ